MAIIGRNASLAASDSGGTKRVLTCKANTVTLDQSADQTESTSFCDDTQVYFADGMQDWTLTLQGFWDGTSNEIDEVMFGLYGASTMIEFGPAGSTAATCPMYRGHGILTDYEVNFGSADGGKISATFAAHSGSMTLTTY